MGLDPDYNVLCKKSDSENIYIWDLERIWLNYQSVIDCFVFDKAMHEIPCIQFMTMWKINKIAFFLVFKNDGRNHAVLVEPDAGNPLIHSSS